MYPVNKTVMHRFYSLPTASATTKSKNKVLIYAYSAFAALILALTVVMATGHRFVPVAPKISLRYKDESPYDIRKVALLIENRPMPHLVPLLLHFTAVIPQDWRVNFMGSDESLALVNSSSGVKNQVALGKMDLTKIPSNMSVGGTEEISAFLTNLWVYETLLAPAEWLLIFQTDSILCANSGQSLNDYLEYDWVGAPWSFDEHNWKYPGGNGGLSLRRVSSIIEILKHQVRLPNSEPEDLWLSRRLSTRKGSKVADGWTEFKFSTEGIFSDKVMGYHLGGSGKVLSSMVWGDAEKREKIYDYCPEVKMILEMDHAQFIPGDCHSSWRRSAADRIQYLVPF